MDRDGSKSARVEALHESVGAALGADEHDRPVAVSLQLLDERLETLFVADRDESMLHQRLRAVCWRAVLVGYRTRRVTGRQVARDPLEGGGEEQRLPRRGARADDALDRGSESHVEHSVGLVQHEHPDPRERERPARKEILEAAGGGDEDVRAFRASSLRRDADTAIDGGDPQVLSAGEILQLGHDLRGQLARWSQHETRRGCPPGVEALHKRDAERERLARTGRRLDEDVPTGQHVLDDEPLDREGCRDSTAGEGATDGTGDAEIGEGLLGHALLLPALAGACGSKALADPNRFTRDSSELTSRPKSLDRRRRR